MQSCVCDFCSFTDWVLVCDWVLRLIFWYFVTVVVLASTTQSVTMIYCLWYIGEAHAQIFHGSGIFLRLCQFSATPLGRSSKILSLFLSGVFFALSLACQMPYNPWFYVRYFCRYAIKGYNYNLAYDTFCAKYTTVEASKEFYIWNTLLLISLPYMEITDEFYCTFFLINMVSNTLLIIIALFLYFLSFNSPL